MDVVGTMKRDTLDSIQSEHVDTWLKLWHSWATSERYGTGYPGVAAGCVMYRASRQYDDQNGALDRAADIAEAKAVNGVIQGMDTDYQSALAMEALSLCSVRVFRSARLGDRFKEVVPLARAALWDGMATAGLTE